MSKVCDHTSVGALLIKTDKILLINRKKPPFGLALPAGHVDEHGKGEASEEARYEAAARAELAEEVGLQAGSLTLVIEGRKDYPCRRESGDWHYWRIYKAEAEGDASFSREETQGHLWASKKQMEKLLAGGSVDLIYDGAMNTVSLEPVWLEWFREMDVLKFYR